MLFTRHDAAYSSIVYQKGLFSLSLSFSLYSQWKWSDRYCPRVLDARNFVVSFRRQFKRTGVAKRAWWSNAFRFYARFRVRSILRVSTVAQHGPDFEPRLLDSEPWEWRPRGIAPIARVFIFPTRSIIYLFFDLTSTLREESLQEEQIALVRFTTGIFFASRIRSFTTTTASFLLQNVPSIFENCAKPSNGRTCIRKQRRGRFSSRKSRRGLVTLLITSSRWLIDPWIVSIDRRRLLIIEYSLSTWENLRHRCVRTLIPPGIGWRTLWVRTYLGWKFTRYRTWILRFTSSLLSLSVITGFPLELVPKLRGTGNLWRTGGEERRQDREDGETFTEFSFTGRSHTTEHSSRTGWWIEKKTTFLMVGLSARLCLRGGASGSLYKRSWPGGGRVCLPVKPSRRLDAFA